MKKFFLVDDDPGACSVPRGGGWRPGARWAHEGARDDRPSKAELAAQIDAMPPHKRPPTRELGRRSEAAPHPFRTLPGVDGGGPAPVRYAAPAIPQKPLVLVETVGQRDLITAACPAAQALGLGIGGTVTEARVLVADLEVRPAEPDADAAWLERLADHALRHWSPVVATDPTDGLWLDLEGVAHLFGGEDRFCRRVVAFLARIGFTARIAVADTSGAAHALARFGREAVTVAPRGETVAAIAALPLDALRLTPDAARAGKLFGLTTVNDLLAMPRAPLARRLGMAALNRLDQATGRETEAIVPRLLAEPLVVCRQLVEPVSTAEAIGVIIDALVRDLVARLTERGHGARRLRMVFQRVDDREQVISLGTASASRDAAHLIRLFTLKIETVDPGLGIEGASLTAERSEPLAAVQTRAALAGETAPSDVAPLVDQLMGRVGDAAVFRIAPVESDVPERAVMRTDPLARPGAWPDWRRPARLLRRPEPLTNVMALLPDHPPRRFTWRGIPHVVVAGDGPERIYGEWWVRDGELSAVRDYFRVEDSAGRHYWLFRRGDGVDAETGDLSWCMHGVG